MRQFSQSDAAMSIAAPFIVGVVIIVLWEIGCRAWQVPIYLFPKPSDIALKLASDWPTLMRALGITLRIALQAFAVAIILGTLIAFLFVQSRMIEMSLFPYAVLLQVTPIVAIAPLIIILVTDTRAALVLCAVVVAIFPIISNTTLGLRSVDHGLLDLFRLCRASRWQILTRLRIPSALALIGAVVAEFVAGTGGAGAGLAYQILLAGMQLNVPRLFAALFLIAMSGVVLFAATVALSRIALSRWHESETTPAG